MRVRSAAVDSVQSGQSVVMTRFVEAQVRSAVVAIRFVVAAETVVVAAVAFVELAAVVEEFVGALEFVLVERAFVAFESVVMTVD